MTTSARFLSASEAAMQLGVSPKALRLYEQRGLVVPGRTAAGWRTYGPDDMVRAAEIVALRALGLSLAEVAAVLSGDPQLLDRALLAHQATLDRRMRELTDAAGKVRNLRAGLARGTLPAPGELGRMLRPASAPAVGFELPWPWGGERFELAEIAPITYLIGPLGSGKTRLARRLAETLPDATFLGLDRLEQGGAAAQARLEADSGLRSRVEAATRWLVDDGAARSAALLALLAGLEQEGNAPIVVDLVEQGLDQPTQEAVIAYLRRRGPDAPPLFLMTRSSSILDLAAIGADEAIILCPANHSPPTRVAPYPGAPGYEAVATCLATPEVRARTEGVVASRPPQAEPLPSSV